MWALCSYSYYYNGYKGMELIIQAYEKKLGIAEHASLTVYLISLLEVIITCILLLAAKRDSADTDK
jgi:hypothetical protein